MKVPYDVIGDIAILKLPEKMFFVRRKWIAWRFLRQHKSIKVVVEKVGKFSGRLRKPESRWLAGEKRRETIHSENDCKFLLDIDETYFSPRLSNERKVISDEIVSSVTKKKNKILVMFAGVAPFPIVLARSLKKAKKFGEVISNELNSQANFFAEKNILLNKVGNFVRLEKGDANKLPSKLREKFDFIIMARPNLKDTFLKSALKLSKKGTKIFYYGFGTEEEVLEEIKLDAEGKIGKIKIRRAGDIGKGKWRWLVEFVVK